MCLCVSKHAAGSEGEGPSENGFHTSVSAFCENKRMIIVVVVIDRFRNQSGESFSVVQYRLILAVSLSVQLLTIYTDFHLNVIFFLFLPCVPAFI